MIEVLPLPFCTENQYLKLNTLLLNMQASKEVTSKTSLSHSNLHLQLNLEINQKLFIAKVSLVVSS